MKKFVVLVVISLFVSAAGMAIENSSASVSQMSEIQKKDKKGGDPAKMAQAETQKLTDALKLNADQQAKVLGINKNYGGKLAELKTKMGSASEADKEALKKEMKKLKGQKDKEIKALLTPEQVTLLNNMKKEEPKKVKK